MMDTSEQYVEMCQKATEIQDKAKASPPTMGRYIFDGKFCVDEYDRLWLADEKTWLPRQGQLQEMFTEYDQISFLLKDFFNAVNMNWRGNEYFWQFEKFEQLWLAFVMREKFNKIWDGENWHDA